MGRSGPWSVIRGAFHAHESRANLVSVCCEVWALRVMDSEERMMANGWSGEGNGRKLEQVDGRRPGGSGRRFSGARGKSLVITSSL